MGDNFLYISSQNWRPVDAFDDNDSDDDSDEDVAKCLGRVCQKSSDVPFLPFS